jgi:hypothetical protein
LRLLFAQGDLGAATWAKMAEAQRGPVGEGEGGEVMDDWDHLDQGGDANTLIAIDNLDRASRAAEDSW